VRERHCKNTAQGIAISHVKCNADSTTQRGAVGVTQHAAQQQKPKVSGGARKQLLALQRCTEALSATLVLTGSGASSSKSASAAPGLRSSLSMVRCGSWQTRPSRMRSASYSRTDRPPDTQGSTAQNHLTPLPQSAGRCWEQGKACFNMWLLGRSLPESARQPRGHAGQSTPPPPSPLDSPVAPGFDRHSPAAVAQQCTGTWP
jgi:hypothetical protein